MSKPTGAQLNYLHLLMDQAGYDEEDLCLNSGELTRRRVSELIEALQEELYG